MSKEEFLKIQTCVLKVNIHCDGCKRKVKKILQKIDGVYKINIESELGKVTVSGNVDPPTLIKKLSKNGKYAELWGAPKPNQNPENQIENQFKNLQIDSGKGGNANGPLKGGQNGQKGGGESVPNKAGLNGINPNQLGQQMKSLPDMKFPQLKDQKMPMGLPFGNDNSKGGQGKKNVTFNLPIDENDQSDGELDEEYDDDDDGDEDYDDEEMDEDDDDENEEVLLNNNKMKPMVDNDGKIPNMMGKIGNVGGDGGQNGKKGGGGDGSGKNGQIQGEGKNGKGGGGEGKMGNNGGGNQSKGNGGGGQNGNLAMNGGKKGAGGISDGLQGLPNMGGPGVGKLGNMPIVSMGSMGPMGNGVQMGQGSAVQGLPATALGDFAGVGPDPAHQQQQQLAALMMNQQRANGNERFQPMMYARPPPAVNYMPPYPYPYPYPYQCPPPGEPYAHAFNEENSGSCNVM